MKLVIIGGVAGGASAAARARRLSEDAVIVMLERGPDASFANCGMPYYLGGTIEDRGKLLVTKPALWSGRYNIDVRTRTSALAINRERKTVKVRDDATGREYEESYDNLILAPGAAPVMPPWPGRELPGIFTLRNLEDMDKIQAAVSDAAKAAVVIGAGFIGLEMVENLVHRGLQVTLVELNEQILPPMDREMTAPLVHALVQKGVRLLTGVTTEGFAPADASQGGGVRVRLQGGEILRADAVIVGVGVLPENRLAKDAGLSIGNRGGVIVDESMRTSDPCIYAVGDAVEIKDFVTGNPTQVPLAGPANRQGRIAADAVFGKTSAYRGTQGTAVLGLFGQVAAITGASEKVLVRAKIPYAKVYVHPNNHAGYYPGAEVMTLKVIFDPTTGRLLGAQAVGGAGVDKRIDVLAMAIQAQMSVEDLEEAELAYAPQFGSAKDAVNMAGFAASNVLRGEQPTVHVEDLAKGGNAESYALIDVRTPVEFHADHIANAVLIPLDELRNRINELPRDRPIAAYCAAGLRGYLAVRMLRQKGFDAYNLSGGFRTYRMHHPKAPA